jgi:DNA-binding NarL/FixJ family response regulator
MQSQPTTKLCKRRILVAEDHPLVRQALRQLINQQPDLVCCGTAEKVSELSPAVRAGNPDLLLLDMGLRDGNSLPYVQTLREEFPSLGILVVSQCDENVYAEPALRGGANGYIMKEQASDEIFNAIRHILSGEIYLSPRVAARLSGQFSGVRQQTGIPALEDLSARELQVLQLLGAGMGTRAVAVELGLSVKTVESYRENLKAKIGLRTGEELVHWASLWVGGKLGLQEDPAASGPPVSRSHR